MGLLTIDSDACIQKIVRNYNKGQNLVDRYDTLRKSQQVFCNTYQRPDGVP